MSPVTEPRIGWQVILKTYAPPEEGGWLIGRKEVGEPHPSYVEAACAARKVAVVGRSTLTIECVRVSREPQRVEGK